MHNRELIGLDVGQAKTGLARASTAARLAEPLETVKTDNLIERLNQLLKDNDIEALIIGLPRNLDGDDTAQTKWVREFVAKLKTEVTGSFFWQDEALTTKNAKGSADDHQLAAQTILQDWIDTEPSERVLC